LHFYLATSWLDPIVNIMQQIVNAIHTVVPNLGWCLVILALLIRLVFWPLNVKQFKSMLAMQKIAPLLKKLQEKYAKSDPKKYQEETMNLYKTSGANPLAGCWPMLVQYPFLIAVFYMVTAHKDLYAKTHFLWIGSPLSLEYPKVFAANLAGADWIILVLYAVSMYISMRFTTMPPADPAQANQMKIMQIISPLMIGFFAIKAQWPSAMVLYWFSSNAFTMGQQLFMLRRYHQPLSLIDSDHAITQDVPAAPQRALNAAGGAPTTKKKKKKGASK
jgi:YidC/Oxa1 family membrane protein insertase